MIRSAVKLSAALLALSLAAPVSLGVLPVTPVAAEEVEATSLTLTQATAASELLLKALQSKDGAAMHSELAESIRGVVSVDVVQKRLDQNTAITGARVVNVAPGYSDTTVPTVAGLLKNNPSSFSMTSDGCTAFLFVVTVSETSPVLPIKSKPTVVSCV